MPLRFGQITLRLSFRWFPASFQFHFHVSKNLSSSLVFVTIFFFVFCGLNVAPLSAPSSVSSSAFFVAPYFPPLPVLVIIVNSHKGKPSFPYDQTAVPPCRLVVFFRQSRFGFSLRGRLFDSLRGRWSPHCIEWRLAGLGP